MPRRILLIEDDLVTQEVMTAILTEAGYQVEGWTQGSKVADLVQTSPPDLVLLDVMLPGHSGLEVAQQLFAASIPFAFCSALSYTEELRQVLCATYHAVDYFVKPVDVATLLPRLRELLGA